MYTSPAETVQKLGLQVEVEATPFWATPHSLDAKSRDFRAVRMSCYVMDKPPVAPPHYTESSAALIGNGECKCVCRTYMSAMFMIVLFFSFGGMPQLAMALQNRTIWFKHRDCNMYTALSYVWSMSIVQLPLSCMEALVFSSIAYFMIGFSTGALSVYPASCTTQGHNHFYFTVFSRN
jgi:hypothetical protein